MTPDTLCFATFVFGSYQKYIPFYIYSISKTYPEAYIKIFTKDRLFSNVEQSLIFLKNFGAKFEIISEYKDDAHFEDFRMGSGNATGKLARWIIEEDHFTSFKYCYISDIDFIFLPEQKHIIDFHSENINTLKLPFSNKVRSDSMGNVVPRITGCHFIEVQPYFKNVTPIIQNLYNDEVFRKEFLNGLQRDEHFLYKLMKSAFEFDDEILKTIERPWHGVHIGISRGNKDVDINVLEENTSLSIEETRKFLTEFSNDKLFQQLQKLVYVLELDVIMEKLQVPRPLDWKINRIKNSFQESFKTAKKKLRNVIGR